MDTINKYGAALGIISLLLGALVYLFTTVKRGRQDIVRTDNADLRASNQELRNEKAGFIATITQQTDTIKNLREVATQTPAVTQLLELSSKQQVITQKQHSEVMTQLSHVAKEMSKMTAAIAAAFTEAKG